MRRTFCTCWPWALAVFLFAAASTFLIVRYRHAPKGALWPDGATALCNDPGPDGKPRFSYSEGPHGLCSHYGGVRVFRGGRKPKR